MLFAADPTGSSGRSSTGINTVLLVLLDPPCRGCLDLPSRGTWYPGHVAGGLDPVRRSALRRDGVRPVVAWTTRSGVGVAVGPTWSSRIPPPDFSSSRRSGSFVGPERCRILARDAVPRAVTATSAARRWRTWLSRATATPTGPARAVRRRWKPDRPNSRWWRGTIAPSPRGARDDGDDVLAHVRDATAGALT